MRKGRRVRRRREGAPFYLDRSIRSPGIVTEVRALAVNCSPKMEKGNTALILNPFVEGMRDAGAQVKVMYSKRMDIKPCTGEFRCWYGTPGCCYVKDDMADVLAQVRASDYWILGVPVYAKLPGEVQNIFNRTMPLFQEKVVVRGRSFLPALREPLKLKRVVLVSSCGYWGLENFELVIEMMEFMAKAFDSRLARPLLRPNANMLRSGGARRQTARAITDAARKAGSELVTKGDITAKTARLVQMPMMSRDEFLRHG